MKKLSKKNKQYLIYGIIGLVVVLLIIFISMSFGGDPRDITRKVLTEKEKYAMFEAEVACDLASYSNPSDMWTSMGEISQLADKYEYTAEDMTNLKTKYENDLEFAQLTMDAMRDICPEVIEKILG